MGNSEWSREDVLEYFGEYLETELVADEVMNAVEERIGRGAKFRHKMLAFREYLREEFGIRDVPMCLGYRRVKK